MKYDDMAEDILRYADAKKISKFTLLGHSMGGKISMNLASIFSQRINGLIIIDSPPKNYSKSPEFKTNTYNSLKKLQSHLNIETMNRDQALDMFFNMFKEERAFANIIAQNVSYQINQELGVKWTNNMRSIFDNLEEIFSFETKHRYPKNDFLIICGSNSYKVSPQIYQNVFPNISSRNLKIINGAGHWVHSDKPKETIREISLFLRDLDSGSFN